jgi:hypothetical protein
VGYQFMVEKTVGNGRTAILSRLPTPEDLELVGK